MQSIKNFFQKYKHGWVAVYALIYLPWFAWLEQHITDNFHLVHMSIDDKIPFVEFFVVPYFLWFGYVAFGIGYFFLKDRQDFYKLCTFLFTGMTIFLIVSTIYPNGHDLRPDTFVRNNIFTDLVKWHYATDTPTNLFPSIHVYNALGIHIAISKSEHFKKHGRGWVISLILCVSIILSTMFLKQHSFFDVITAFAMAGILYALVYVRHPERRTSVARHT